MSNLRHAESTGDPDADVLVRSYAVTHPPRLDLAERVYPGWDQLAYASRGVMEIQTQRGRWVIPPQRAVWIPAGERHAIHMSSAVAVRSLFFHCLQGHLRPPCCRAIAVGPLLRELILEICRRQVLRAGVPEQARLAALVIDLLAEAVDVPLSLPMPAEPRARALAVRILAHPEEPLALAVRCVPASRRTLERLFLRETHLTLGGWQRRARLAAALKLLAEGHGSTRVALEVGYRSPSAFVAAFGATLGCAPGRYFDRGV